MGSKGRLHMGDYVGDTFEKTGLLEPSKTSLSDYGDNRKARRKEAKLNRQHERRLKRAEKLI